MNRKRISNEVNNESKKVKVANTECYLFKCLRDSGLDLKHPPEKCEVTEETIIVIRNIKKNLQKHYEYPRNVSEMFSDLTKECEDNDIFKHYLFNNIVRKCDESQDEHMLNDSVFKILLNVPVIQNKLTDYIFEKAIYLATESKCGPWIQMILKSFTNLDNINNTDKIANALINLLDISSEKIVKLEVITTLPDIIGDQEHENIADELSRILSEDHDLVPAILECLSYLCLSNDKYEALQKKTLNILNNLPVCNYFPNFVKFLLLSGITSDNLYLDAVSGLRNALSWPSSISKPQDIATSQVLTATAIRNSMLSSKVIANSWFKVVFNCKVAADYKPFDFVIMLILYSTFNDKQKTVENLLRKQIKNNILKKEMLDDVFSKFKPIIKEFLKQLIELNNSLLQSNSDVILMLFASHIYTLMFSCLEESCQSIVAELLQLGLDRKQCVLNVLQILNNIANKNISLIKPQSIQMLTLLDRMDTMSLNEIRLVMNLICGLAFTYENSVIRDDMHIIIRKELGSSSPIVKIQGILAGVYAVKYLMVSNAEEDNTVDLPDDISYSSVTHLADGDLREAAQIVELISRCTKQFPDMIAFFYDELSQIISDSSFINKHFLAWLTDAVTNDLQQHFIVDSIENENIGQIKLGMKYCINEESEMDEVIAINITGLALLQSQNDINISILCPLFQLVQTLHSKQHNGNLSSIDALLGCAVVMPTFDIDLMEDMDQSDVKNILDCLIFCINWFRELLNAFSEQNDSDQKSKIFVRILQIEKIENLIRDILMKTKVAYRPNIHTLGVNKYFENISPKKLSKSNVLKQHNINKDETVLTQTKKSQSTQHNIALKNKLDLIDNIHYRNLNSSVIHIVNSNLHVGEDCNDSEMTVKTLIYVLKCLNIINEKILISKIKQNTSFCKLDTDANYNPKEAEKTVLFLNKFLPKVTDHLKTIVSNAYEETQINNENLLQDCEYCIELIFDFYTIYFKWIGFKNQQHGLLKSSLRSIVTVDSGDDTILTLKELVLESVKYLQIHEKYCSRLSTAVSLINLIMAIHEHGYSLIIQNILRDMAKKFLSTQWKTSTGSIEKGLAYNKSIDKLAEIYFINNEIVALHTISIQLTEEIQILKTKNDYLSSFQSINKANFPVLYRNLGTAVYEATKSFLDKGSTNDEHLILWKHVAVILKHMSDMTKVLETRNNLSVFFKKSLPIIKLFISHGIPILEIQFKNKTQEVLEILKILQQSTRFLQSLCCHSRLKKETALISKVPFMRQLLETLIYKVKAALTVNNCSEAFWMGNLKNKNIHGEVIASQQSNESEDSVDCDKLPEDDDSDNSDEELNPDSKSVSDIV